MTVHGLCRSLVVPVAALVAVSLLWTAGLAGQAPEIIRAVRAAIARQAFADGERLIDDYRRSRGVTPEMLEALSWLGRGALAADQLDQAGAYARQTYDLAQVALKTRPMDAEPRLPIALGAAIEVTGQVRARSGSRSEAVVYLMQQLNAYRTTSLNQRIQKNINLLSLVGTTAPALDLGESLAPSPLSLSSLKGKVALLFFWAHWCPDCKNQAPALAALTRKYAAQGLVVVAPTQRYGYVAGGRDAAADEENRYISQIRATHYGFIPENAVPLSEANHLRYGVSTTPTLVLVDRTGTVRLYHPGAMSEAELETAVRGALQEAAPSSGQ